jgi:hypothetical protein
MAIGRKAGGLIKLFALIGGGILAWRFFRAPSRPVLAAGPSTLKLLATGAGIQFQIWILDPSKPNFIGAPISVGQIIDRGLPVSIEVRDPEIDQQLLFEASTQIADAGLDIDVVGFNA